MTEEQFLEGTKAYHNQQLEEIKAQGNLEIDSLLVQSHSNNVTNAITAIAEENKIRLREIASAKSKFSRHFEEMVKPMIKATNHRFNSMLSKWENSANVFYERCVERGLTVKIIDFSSLKVNEYDGI